ncbi:MAG: hypothetical protein K5891_04320 [Lachnospiraceae bacterium]|nr:hypothetical protein [Lachnospiraceae bacterium]
MHELRVIKVAELRSRLGVIPVKLLVSCLLLIGFDILLLGEGWTTETLLAYMQGDLPMQGITLVILYGVVSYLYFFIRLMHHWILGIAAGILVAVLLWNTREHMQGQTLLIAVCIMLFGGPVLDLLNFLRYRSLRRKVIRESNRRYRYDTEEDDSYGRGYESGFDSGYERGRMSARQDRRDRYIESDYDEDDRYLQRRRDDREADYEEDDRYIEDRDYDGYDDGYDGEAEDDYAEEPVSRGRGGSGDPGGFFRGCTDEASIKRRYRELCKVYHPDGGNGSEEIFEEIGEQYRALTGTR